MTVCEIRLTEEAQNGLLAHLLGNPKGYEEGAILLAGRVRTDHSLVFLVRDVVPIPREALAHQSGGYLEARPEFLANIVKRARLGSLSIFLAHSHPFSGGAVSFSSIDDEGERRLVPKLYARVPVEHGALVFGHGAFTGRVWITGTGPCVGVHSLRIVGIPLRHLNPSLSHENPTPIDPVYDRQIRALGVEGSRAIRRMRAGVVGLGGNGSHVVQALAHMGLAEIIGIDNDPVEIHSRPRLIGSRPEDAVEGLLKVSVMERLVRDINPSVAFLGIAKRVQHAEAVDALKEADVVFGCTDNWSSRNFLNDFAFRYLVPLIDMGLEVQPNQDGSIRRAAGYVFTVIPGQSCLRCMGIVTKELLDTEGERRSGAYLGEIVEPAGQVVVFNGLVAYHALVEFVALATGFRGKAQGPIYRTIDFLRGESRRQSINFITTCTHREQLLAIGDTIGI